MTLLQIVQQAYGELGLSPIPSNVVSSTDPQVVQMLALLQRHGHDLCRQFDWERLDKEYLITTVAYSRTGNVTAGSAVITNIPSTTGITTAFQVAGNGIAPFAQILSVDSPTQVTMNQVAQISGTGVALEFAQTAYPLPSDWLKQIPQTEWDRTNRWPMLGPKSPQEWQSFKSGIVYAGPRERFRIQGNAFNVNPPPPNALTFAFEYISNSWVYSASGTAQTQFLADTDTTVFDDSLMVAGLKLRWRQAKGFDYAFDADEYSGLLSQIKAQDKSSPKLSLSPVAGNIYLSPMNVPDGNWQG